MSLEKYQKNRKISARFTADILPLHAQMKGNALYVSVQFQITYYLSHGVSVGIKDTKTLVR